MFENTKIQREKSQKRWFFDSFFGWNKGSITLQNIANKNDKITFEGEINYNPKGVYFLNISGKPDLSRFDYMDKEDNKIAHVIDYTIILNCQVEEYKGNGLKFKLREIRSKNNQFNENKYDFTITYGAASNFFGSHDTKKTISKIKENCQARQNEIKKKLLEYEKIMMEKKKAAELFIKEGFEKLNEYQKKFSEGFKKVKTSAEETLKNVQNSIMKGMETIGRAVEERNKKILKEEAKKAQITEDPHQTISLVIEKQIFAEDMKSIKVIYPTKIEQGLFITGDKDYLGNWNTMYPLLPPTNDNKYWEFRSEKLKNDDVFKIIFYSYSTNPVDISNQKEDIFLKKSDKCLEFTNRKQLEECSIIYQKPAGSKGNTKLKLKDNSMIHQPTFVEKN